MTPRTILWRRLDRPGHEAARLSAEGEGFRLDGSSVFADEAGACRLDYVIRCDARWHTTRATVDGWIADRVVHVEVDVLPQGRWQVNRAEAPAVAGCLDLDLNWSPVTNLLPIRRLGLDVGGQSPVRAAWLRFPSLALEPLDQVYRRLDERTYRYESGGGRFTAELEVDDAGFVLVYPGLFERDSPDDRGAT
jgi:hypothetical protein